MTLRIYDTLTRSKSEFKTIEEGKVRMYVCGPTVYDSAHVGHAMFALVFDIIRRYLIYRGYEVNYVMNFTDVDDKIIDRANRLGVDPFELAEKYIEEFKHNLRDLNILPASENPRATNEIDTIIKMVSQLIEKGSAYEVDGDVYFRVETAKDYGKLSGRKLEEMNAGSRIRVDERKENPMDFAVWKKAKPGELAWDSPWGPGRPGWHIECSAMNLSHLGEQIDIHGGGNDLIFPHHENEIAQTEAITGKPFARYWMHNGMLQLKGEKMSKSTGNLVPISEFLNEYSGDVLRLLVLSSYYRSPLTFNSEVIEANQRALERLLSALRPAQPGAAGASKAVLGVLAEQLEATQQGFVESMDEDFNFAGALGHIFDLVRAINQARAEQATDEQLAPAQTGFKLLTDVLGLELKTPELTTTGADAFIDLILALRKELRQKKLYELSDHVRDELMKLGVIIEDTPQGSTWRWE
ncbi:MAG: Cysteine--tRNA ligase [Chloroflexi bacterium ADurb.Bin120]|jgi:cysteinyl-tRNA synthetase|uniref:Cysteine--tRNA ligase n=1 Tax=Candidatus Brevifilum fermentans TaxID=1986204 RepID=A0A1Y6K5G7_9CHLR|nr:cysteine--tRNA ligase [Brevefilum fermentans]OQB82917.1 MAG: Cysteine--tRNA ligase [Chloroflexi bacterium ADurb.Bin120]SMX54925.1 Cysteine--tRNA ligase [Brevefilum fermentans]HOM67300.1 cysteine--tRNA ligase [Brevefilum fermentans]